MPVGEFDLIAKYFSRPVRHAVLGGGDDCALLQPTPGMQWAVSTDALVVPTSIMGSNRPRKWLFRQAKLRVDFGPPRTWRELAGANAGLEPGRGLYESVGAGVMREIGLLRARQLNEAVRGTATP